MIPRHVGIIMDGNGRWAKQRGLPRTIGHTEAVSVVRDVVRRSGERGIRFLTLYAFAKLNWRRPPDEVARLFGLLGEVIASEALELGKQNVRVRVLGDIAGIPEAARTALDNLVATTAGNTGLVLSLAINYDGRNAIAVAASRASEADTGERITADSLAAALDTSDLAPLDMVIRTGGEHRLSGFMTWESAYAEIFFTDTFWPDFAIAEYDRLIDAFAKRERRFGQTSEQLQAPEFIEEPARSTESAIAAAASGPATPPPVPEISLDALRASDDSVVQAFCEEYAIRCAYLPFDRTRRHALHALGAPKPTPDRMIFFIVNALAATVSQCYDLGLKTVIVLGTTLGMVARGEGYGNALVKGMQRYLFGDGSVRFYTKYRPQVLLNGPPDKWATSFGVPAMDTLFEQLRQATARHSNRTLVLFHSEAGPADYLSVSRLSDGATTLDEAIANYYGGPVDPVDFSIFAGAPQEFSLPPLLWSRSLRCTMTRSQLTLDRAQLIQAIYATALSRGLTDEDAVEPGSYKDDTDLCRRLHVLTMLD